jgi:hypothetical protein
VTKKTVARLALLPAGLVAGLGWASSALAASGVAGDAHGNVAASSAETLGAAKGAATLPFTGLGLTLIVAAGLLLLALGFGMRRLSHTRS